MAKHGIRHIVLVADGRLTGVISERDLFTLQRASLRRAADRIRGANSVTALAEAAADIRLLARSLLVQGMGAEQLTEVVSALNDSLARRLIDMIAARHALPRGWCWIALGSEGRMEQTLATDQDNALILEPGTSEAQRKPFLAFADEVNRALDACGFPLCKGDIMARNPKWCLPLEGWRAIFDGWIRNPDPKALLNAAIFFDLRPLAGETQLAGQLRDGLLAQTAGNPAFLRAMASNALQVRPPIGLLRDFVTDDSKEFPNTLDLKMLGVRPYVDAARVWALAHRLAGTGTAERLRGAAKAGAMPEQEAADACAAFHFIQALRLRHQHLEQPAPGGENRIDPDALNALDRRLLKETFRQTGKLQERLRLDYQL
jgi:CBS domain-containing protein